MVRADVRTPPVDQDEVERTIAYHAEQLATYLAPPAISGKHLESARWHNYHIRNNIAVLASIGSGAGDVREALEKALADMVRLADMGLEESLREPEENGNYAAYTRAKNLLAALKSTDTP